MADWSPEKYLSFAAERARPARDLLAQIPNRSPTLVHDLGCGPGNATQLLRAAFPAARILAIDSSPAMIAQAKASRVDAEFSVGDVIEWVPDQSADVIFSNALFQWVPQHDQQLLRIFRAMKAGSVLAVQMPDNLQEPSHRLMPDAAQGFMSNSAREKVLSARSPVLSATHYFELLSPLAQHMDVWRTTYYHLLKSHSAIAEMFSSTGLKPWLEVVEPDSAGDFLKSYVELIAPHYKAATDGRVVYPFPRLFILAVRM